MASSAAASPLVVSGPLRLEPFRGLMLSPGRVGDPASARAFARPYQDVPLRLQRWENQGRLVHDQIPALYIHEYTSAGITVRGLVGALDLSHHATDPHEAVVLPHEAVHPEQAVGLAARMSAMRLNPAPILLVHRGPAAIRRLVTTAITDEPEQVFTDRAGQLHRIWAVRDPARLDRVRHGLADARVLLADGHHRYAAYLQMQAAAPGTAADRGLAMLVDQDDTPLFLGAIHRVLPGVSLDDVVAAGATVGTVQETASAAALDALAPDTMVLTDGTRWATLRLPRQSGRAAVETLHHEVLPALRRQPRRIAYHHTLETTLEDVRRIPAVAVIMPATDFDVVRRILASDRLLPEKATSFQPKPNVGVLMRQLDDA